MRRYTTPEVQKCRRRSPTMSESHRTRFQCTDRDTHQQYARYRYTLRTRPVDLIVQLQRNNDKPFLLAKCLESFHGIILPRLFGSPNTTRESTLHRRCHSPQFKSRHGSMTCRGMCRKPSHNIFVPPTFGSPVSHVSHGEMYLSISVVAPILSSPKENIDVYIVQTKGVVSLLRLFSKHLNLGTTKYIALSLAKFASFAKFSTVPRQTQVYHPSRQPSRNRPTPF